MTRRTFSDREVVKALTEMGYAPVDRTGSHLKLCYVHPETDETRNVTVSIHDEIDSETLRSIAAQCGADDFDVWCTWIENLL